MTDILEGCTWVKVRNEVIHLDCMSVEDARLTIIFGREGQEPQETCDRCDECLKTS